MSSEIIPAGDGSDGATSDGGSGNQTYARSTPGKSIPSREECMAAIAALSGLVAMRIITPAQSNSIRDNNEAIMRQHDKVGQGQTAQLSDQDVLRMWQEQPHLIELLEPVLSKEQLDMIMRKARNDGDR